MLIKIFGKYTKISSLITSLRLHYFQIFKQNSSIIEQSAVLLQKTLVTSATISASEINVLTILRSKSSHMWKKWYTDDGLHKRESGIHRYEHHISIVELFQVPRRMKVNRRNLKLRSKIPLDRVLLEALIVTQLVKNFTGFYRSCRQLLRSKQPATELRGYIIPIHTPNAISLVLKSQT
jgi:hypothetical protein